MSLFPKEHGAYGQVSLPLLTALAVGGPSAGGVLIAAAVVAGFVTHEPAAVLLGLRGPRARGEHRGRALWWLGVCLTVGVAAGAGAWVAMPTHTRWSFVVPVVPALGLLAAMLRGREKSALGEAAAALAFSGAALPVSLAGGASPGTGLAIALPFAALFVTTTLAVRVVILKVRGGGDPRAAAATRTLTLALAGGMAAALVALGASGILRPSIVVASAPGLITASAIAARPPSPGRLRTIGWTLVAVSILTAALVIITG